MRKKITIKEDFKSMHDYYSEGYENGFTLAFKILAYIVFFVGLLTFLIMITGGYHG